VGNRELKERIEVKRLGVFENCPAVMTCALSEQGPLSAPRAMSLGIPLKKI